jgi:hypothetical protein
MNNIITTCKAICVKFVLSYIFCVYLAIYSSAEEWPGLAVAVAVAVVVLVELQRIQVSNHKNNSFAAREVYTPRHRGRRNFRPTTMLASRM